MISGVQARMCLLSGYPEGSMARGEGARESACDLCCKFCLGRGGVACRGVGLGSEMRWIQTDADTGPGPRLQPHQTEEVRNLSGVSFYKGINLIQETSAL